MLRLVGFFNFVTNLRNLKCLMELNCLVPNFITSYVWYMYTCMSKNSKNSPYNCFEGTSEWQLPEASQYSNQASVMIHFQSFRAGAIGRHTDLPAFVRFNI